MTPSSPRPDPWRRRLSPERIAAVVAAAVLALGTVAVASTIGASEGGSPRATRTPGGAVSAATAHPFADNARYVLTNHLKLVEDREAFDAELAASSFDTGAVVTIVRRLNGLANVGVYASTTLARAQGSRELGQALGVFYEAVAEAADATLDTPARDTVGVRAAAERLRVVLEPTASLQKRLEALIASALATPSVASIPSATPGASAPGPSPTPSPPTFTPTPVASPTPTKAPTAPPATAAPSRLPLIGLVENPGFEAPEADPWVLVTQFPAAATFAIDTAATPFEGAQSGRVDASVPSDDLTGISLRQAGIQLAQGNRYLCRISLRAETAGQVRVRVVSASGATYGTRVWAVGPEWTIFTFEFGTFVADPDAILEIDLGRSAATTWVDAAQIMDVSAFAP